MRANVHRVSDVEAARAAQYDRAYAKTASDPLIFDLHRQAIGDDYPDGIEVVGSCTRGTLERALAGLGLPQDGLLVDLGCGLGGPGRWLARESGTRVLGFDVSQVAVDVAADSARGYLDDGRYEYRRGSFSATGLPDGCADGVIAIESLSMAADRGKALAELHRILRPGRRATFTGGERPGRSWAPLIEEAGLDLISKDVDEARGARWLAVCALQLEHQAELRESLGDDLADEFIQEAREAPSTWGDPDLIGVQYVVSRPAAE